MRGEWPTPPSHSKRLTSKQKLLSNFLNAGSMLYLLNRVIADELEWQLKVISAINQSTSMSRNTAVIAYDADRKLTKPRYTMRAEVIVTVIWYHVAYNSETLSK